MRFRCLFAQSHIQVAKLQRTTSWIALETQASAHGDFYNTASLRSSAHKNISTSIFIQGIKTNFLLPGPALATHSLYHWNGLLTTEVQAWRRDLRLLILGLGCDRGGWGRGSVGHLSHHFLEAFLDHSSSYNVPSLNFSSAALAIPLLAYRSYDLRGRL